MLLIALLVLAVELPAQTASSALTGRVQDATGKPLPGVTILVKKANSAFQENTVTDESGSFSLNRLESGKYQVEAKLAGFQNVAQEVELRQASTHCGPQTHAGADHACRWRARASP
jgi:hypothetical protein